MKDRTIRKRIGRAAAVLLLACLAGSVLAGCSEPEKKAESTVSISEEAETAGSVPAEDTASEEVRTEEVSASAEETPEELPDGTYTVSVEMTGGTGKAHIESPCEIRISSGQAVAAIQWSSPHYDYMIVDGETYDPVNTEGNSRFEIPIVLDREMTVQADTTAMSQPHLIEYTLLFSLQDQDGGADPDTAAADPDGSADEEAGSGRGASVSPEQLNTPPEISGLTFVSSMDKEYAEGFAVFYYEGGYKVLAAQSGRQYLLVSEDSKTPEDLPEDMTVIRTPSDRIYLAASSAMALFHALDALDTLAFSGTDADGWYIEEAAEAMKSGNILYAGKYSEPDYEGLLAGGCDLAIESTMILHSPEVQEKLEALGIPVLIDESSHESHPLGRTEWIRFYGALLDREEEADAFFRTQTAVVDELEEAEKTGKTVAYFFVNSKGNVVVRKTEDYIPKMIELAGGTYVFQDLKNPNPESTSGSVSLSLEEFYAQARDCDYLIYNAAIDNPLNSMKDLLDKSPVFADFKAVKENHVYTTDKYMYQATDIMGEMIRDIHKMLTGADDSGMLFLKKIEA